MPTETWACFFVPSTKIEFFVSCRGKFLSLLKDFGVIIQENVIMG